VLRIQNKFLLKYCFFKASMCALMLVQASAFAGAQIEEALADSVRSALHASIEMPGSSIVDSSDFFSTPAYRPWFEKIKIKLDANLDKRIPSERLPEWQSLQLREELLQIVWYESHRAGLEPSLVLAIINVESGFRKFAVSSAGARGLMQVMPFWVKALSDVQTAVLFQASTNVRFACVILRHYLNLENGDLSFALSRYNGLRGLSTYSQTVLAAQKNWQ